MLSNLFRPWILSRELIALSVFMMSLVALRTAIRVIRHWRIGSTAEGQLALERRAELVAGTVRVMTFGTWIGLLLTVLGAERLSSSVQGAMCSYGVLSHSEWGFRALVFSIVAALSAAAWTALHDYDLALAEPRLTRMKFVGIYFLVPILFADAAANTAFALDLDMTTAASCCSASLGSEEPQPYATAFASPTLVASIALVAALTAFVFSLIAWRRPSTKSGVLAAATSIFALPLSLVAITWFVAPHTYETPLHACPFCLFGAVGNYLGWPMFAAIFVASASAISLAVFSFGASRADPAREEDRARTLGLIRRGGARAALGWAVAIVFAALPVFTFLARSDGVTLFSVSR